MSRLTRDGTAEPVSRDQILRHARGQGDTIFPVQLTTSRIGNLTRLIHTLLCVITIHTSVSLIPPWEDQCEWHRMTRMTGPDCAVMCNLINIHIYIHTQTSQDLRRERHAQLGRDHCCCHRYSQPVITSDSIEDAAQFFLSRSCSSSTSLPDLAIRYSNPFGIWGSAGGGKEVYYVKLSI